MASRAAFAAVLIGGSLLYFGDLGRAPVYLGWDEARFALQGHAIAATGRDMSGLRMPLFFYNFDPLIPNHTTHVWWQPFLIYLTAIVFLFAPLAEWSTRLPIAVLALLNVALIYAAAREIFQRRWAGVTAAALLTLTPAHFLFGRQSMDYFCPLPFALAWIWLLARYHRTGERWLPALIGLLLGAGLYSYIASWIVMPFYLVLTACVLWATGTRRQIVPLGVGFSLPLVPMAVWLWFYPDLPRDLFLGYGLGAHVTMAERITLYWDYFNPSFLFFSGGSEWMWATRQAGVFPLAVAVLLPLGLRVIGHTTSALLAVVVLVAFFFVPVPIAITVPEAPSYATARVLLLIPFGVLISVAGLSWLLERRRLLTSVLAASLLASVPLQFAGFARDYFSDYQARAAFRFDGLNLRDVAAYVIAEDARAPVPAVYLGQHLTTGESVQWKFHLLKHGREDLWDRSRYFSPESFQPEQIAHGSLLVLNTGNPHVDVLLRGGACSVVHTVTDVKGDPVSTILRRN